MNNTKVEENAQTQRTNICPHCDCVTATIDSQCGNCGGVKLRYLKRNDS